MKILLVTLLSLLLQGTTVHSQELDPKALTLKWEVNGLYDVAYDSVSDYHSSFVTYDQSRIAWIQQDGQFVIEFNIRSVKGNWSDTRADGLLQYLTTLDGRRGTITFERKNGKTTIAMNFQGEGTNKFPFVFNVTAVNKLL